MKSRYATIDIGTNTVLCLISSVDEEGAVERLEDLHQITRLGQGLGASKRLHPDAVVRTLAALENAAARIRHHGVPASQVFTIATASLRKAEDSQVFIDLVEQKTGLQIEVIDGSREAQLSAVAVARDFRDVFSKDQTILAIDIGGGSTELVAMKVGDQPRIETAVSLLLGSVWMTESVLRRADPLSSADRTRLTDYIEEALEASPIAWDQPMAVVGLAGTITTLATLCLKLRDYDPEKVHGMALSTDRLEELVDRLWSLPLSERRVLPGLEPQRADVLPAGAQLALQVTKKARSASLWVSDRGIRYGLLYEKIR